MDTTYYCTMAYHSHRPTRSHSLPVTSLYSRKSSRRDRWGLWWWQSGASISVVLRKLDTVNCYKCLDTESWNCHVFHREAAWGDKVYWDGHSSVIWQEVRIMSATDHLGQPGGCMLTWASRLGENSLGFSELQNYKITKNVFTWFRAFREPWTGQMDNKTSSTRLEYTDKHIIKVLFHYTIRSTQFTWPHVLCCGNYSCAPWHAFPVSLQAPFLLSSQV